ncbi:hypothetical protein H2202_010931 [Exophiala xenobiotica]|nr:hypothetical protein H2202_010931 [Exophiala xenobiotica]KAK5215221.1 hypothetical protein LTR72_011705 [Exophiala xenobiotica]KAK5285170.1 hypothetical protein LTR14_011191 [Exophiala xenobiotica]KAK5312104.1 hypothetical protein LTR93_011467 [Exophiala xenobiotica]KAK5469982.1 hypothetical protein LTR55_011271 [Exophiala xenobiotica]
MSTTLLDQFDELPRIKGPKLRRFNDGHYKRIEYLVLLGRSNDEGQLPSGDHGYVFRVRIDGELYALKIFRFFDLGEALVTLDPAGRSRVSQEDIEGQTDPFYAECRAYGRIASKPRKRPIAIACHGFISIPAKQEFFFAKRFNITEWNRPEEELSSPPAMRQPFRALVKDLVETEPEITEKLIASILRELKALNSLRIYVMDVRWSNYKGGHLVDFSSAWTEPHFEFRKDVNSEEDIRISRHIDLAAFNKMVKEELDMDVLVRTEQNPDFIARLRSRRKRED